MGIEVLGLVMSGLILALTIVTIAGVVLLRPLSHRLGDLLEAMAKERNRLNAGGWEPGQAQEWLEGLDERLSLIEERQEFMEALRDERSQSSRIGNGGSREAPGGE